MRSKFKTTSCIILITVCAVLLITGCKNNNKQSENGNTVENQQENHNSLESSEDTLNNETVTDNTATSDKEATENNSADTSASEEDTKEEDTKKQESSQSTKELPIYTINDETLETEPIIEKIPSDTEVTPQVVVDQVLKAFADNSYLVEVQNVSQEGDAIIVNFSKDSAPVLNVGASVECTTLDCISYSLLDNIPDCKKIIFRIDGEAYSTGHIEKGINEPYATGN